VREPDATRGAPLPEFADLAAAGFPDRADHPVLSAILADLRSRTQDGEDPAVAYYEDAP
jgi:hypothetical protein